MNKFYVIPLLHRNKDVCAGFFWCVAFNVTTPQKTGNCRRQQVTMLTFSYIYFLLQSLSNSRAQVVVTSYTLHTLLLLREYNDLQRYSLCNKMPNHKTDFKVFLKMFCRCFGTC